MPLLDHFSMIAPHYDRVFHRANVDVLQGMVSPERSNRLLDVGGGTGRIAQYFVEYVEFVALAEKALLMRSQFYAPEVIRQMLASHGLHAWVETLGTVAWIIAEKE